jgi:hypothetical protein
MASKLDTRPNATAATALTEPNIDGYYILDNKRIKISISPDVNSTDYSIYFENIDNETLELLKMKFKYKINESITMILIGVDKSGGFGKTKGMVKVNITKNAYDNIKKEITSNTVTKKKYLTILSLMRIPDDGQWVSTTRMKIIEDDEKRAEAEAAITGTYPPLSKAGSNRKPKHSRHPTHRKPTKRRRSRRNLNRKTKKN